MVQDQITILIKTFERSEAIQRLLDSIRKFYPTIEVVVVDDSQTPTHITGVTHIITEFDIGLSAGRNLGISHIRTPYVFICDDDCIFTKDTNLEKAIELLKGSKVDILGVDAGIDYYGVFETHTQEYTTVIYRKGTWNQSEESNVKLCDFVPNIFIARTEALQEYQWDPALKMGEHFAYFYKHQGKVKVGYTNNIKIRHDHIDNSKYQPFRNRALTYVKQYMKQAGIQKRIDLDGSIIEV